MTTSIFRRTPILLLALICLSLALPVPGDALAGEADPDSPRDDGPAARAVFERLPPSIFENTLEGLDEEEKERLLETGESSFWEVAGESLDVIAFRNVPLRDSVVAYRLFRGARDGGVVAAAGTLEAPICTLELWRLDASGRIVPLDAPDAPAVSEFFDGGRPPRGVTSSVLVCLGLGGLKAQPVFWGPRGMIRLDADNEIGWLWNGESFEKFVRPAGSGGR